MEPPSSIPIITPHKVSPTNHTSKTGSMSSFFRSKRRAIIRSVAAAHRTLAIATEDETVLWWDTSTASGPKEYDLASKGGRSIEKIFLDPTGHHLIISLLL